MAETVKHLLNRTVLAGLAWAGHVLPRRGVPVLHYHGADGENQGSVTRTAFRDQMCYLAEHGYAVLTLNEVMRTVTGKENPLRRSVAITFDDGCRSVYEHAFPLLLEYRFPATIFLVTGRLGKTVDWETQQDWYGLPLISWAEAREMNAHGIDFGAHTRTHKRLATVSPEKARYEVAGSRAEIEDALGQEVRHFAYPYGARTKRVSEIVRECGFHAAYTTAPGLNTVRTDPFTLRRSGVFRDTTDTGFCTRLSGTFLWYHYAKRYLYARTA